MTLSQITIPRPLTVAVHEFLPLVERLRELETGKLTIRLGSDSGKMGIDEPRFTEILEAMSSYPGWGDVGEWGDVHEYTYTVGDITVSTNVHITKSVSMAHVSKQRLEVVDFKLLNHGSARGCLHVDTPVNEDTIPETVTPSRVRIKKRKVFCRHPWTFAVSRVWKGPTRSMAESAQAKGDTGYDIEIGFTPDPGYWEEHTSTYVATSMLMKMVDVVSAEMISVEPVVK